jgi:hypothetical protein
MKRYVLVLITTETAETELDPWRIMTDDVKANRPCAEYVRNSQRISESSASDDTPRLCPIQSRTTNAPLNIARDSQTRFVTKRRFASRTLYSIAHIGNSLIDIFTQSY